MSEINSYVSSAQGDFTTFASTRGTTYCCLEGIHLAVHPQYLELHINRRPKAQTLQLYKNKNVALGRTND